MDWIYHICNNITYSSSWWIFFIRPPHLPKLYNNITTTHTYSTSLFFPINTLPYPSTSNTPTPPYNAYKLRPPPTHETNYDYSPQYQISRASIFRVSSLHKANSQSHKMSPSRSHIQSYTLLPVDSKTKQVYEKWGPHPITPFQEKGPYGCFDTRVDQIRVGGIPWLLRFLKGLWTLGRDCRRKGGTWMRSRRAGRMRWRLGRRCRRSQGGAWCRRDVLSGSRGGGTDCLIGGKTLLRLRMRRMAILWLVV